MSNTLDLQKLHELELLACGGRVPGTILQRVLMDNTLVKEYRIRVPEGYFGREATLVWSLAVGHLSERKVFFHGWTPNECLENALAYAVKHADEDRIKFVTDTIAKEREVIGHLRQ